MRSIEEFFLDHKEWLKLEYGDAFKNQHKKHRERWCVAKLCESLGIEGRITSEVEEPADVLLLSQGRKFFIQVTECKDEGPRKREYVPVIGNLDLTSPIRKAIEKKKFRRYSSASDLILLIYVNFMYAELNSEDEIDIDFLKTCAEETLFKVVVLRGNCGNVVFLKGAKKII